MWRTIACHDTRMSVYGALQDLSPEHADAIFGTQSFYRVFSRVNGGRQRETDLFEGMSG